MEIFCPFSYIVQKTVRKTVLFHVNVLLGLWDLLQDVFCVHKYTSPTLLAYLKQAKEKEVLYSSMVLAC